MWCGSSERKASAPLRKFSAFERFRRTPLVSVRSPGCHSVRYSSRRALGFAKFSGLAVVARPMLRLERGQGRGKGTRSVVDGGRGDGSARGGSAQERL